MTDDAICDFLDEEGSETEDDRDEVSNEPICQQSSDVRQALDVLRGYIYLVIMESLFTDI